LFFWFLRSFLIFIDVLFWGKLKFKIFFFLGGGDIDIDLLILRTLREGNEDNKKNHFKTSNSIKKNAMRTRDLDINLNGVSEHNLTQLCLFST